MSAYGYLHTARVISQDEASGGWFVESVALARDRRWGPVPSCVTGLAPGDKVVLAATGTTRDNLLILGALDPRYPDIGDIPGLTDALAAKADVTALEALEDATNLNFLVVNDKNAEQDLRLSAAEGVNTTQNGRLTTVESVNSTQDGRLATAEGTLGTHTTELANLQSWMNPAYDWDRYGDLLSPIPRREATNTVTMTANAVYIVKLRPHTAISVGRIRWGLNAVGTGPGNMSGAIYTANSSGGPYTLVKNTSTVAAAAIGLYSIAWSDASTVAIPRGTWTLLALHCSTGYTQNPRLAGGQNSAPAAALLHPAAGQVNIGFKAGLAAFPATISPNDGTWTPLNVEFWAAVAT